jgi:hypothetical protein
MQLSDTQMMATMDVIKAYYRNITENPSENATISTMVATTLAVIEWKRHMPKETVYCSESRSITLDDALDKLLADIKEATTSQDKVIADVARKCFRGLMVL